jgi:hypothetical protein
MYKRKLIRSLVSISRFSISRFNIFRVNIFRVNIFRFNIFRVNLFRIILSPFILLTVSMFFTSASLQAQELNARVTIVNSQVSSATDAKVFLTLKTALSDFLNKRKWTSETYAPQEKISCNFLLNIQSTPEPSVFKASLTVQAARPVYNSSYQAPLINFLDNDVQFRYQEYQPLEFNEARIAGAEPLAGNLTALFAYYVNLIVALDNDSFSPRGGDPYFQKASAIVSSAPDGRVITGWKAFDGQRNRYWLIENLTNSRYTLVHDAYYTYYRMGLDKLYENEIEAREQILNAINLLYSLGVDNPNIMILNFFFQGKSEEIVRILKKSNSSDRARAIEMLSKIDITNAAKYKTDLK